MMLTVQQRVAGITICVAATIAAAFAVRMGAAGAATTANAIPNVTLTTHDGAQVRFYDDLVKGKIVAINLIYTTCQYACPLETARLAQVQRLLGDRMGRDIFFYSITIDPEHDTPAVLEDYARKFHAGPGWIFLTGTRTDIDLISKKMGLYAPPAASSPDNHKPYLLVGNERTGQWMRQSAVDNPAFLATTIGDWLNSWQSPKREPLKSYAEMPPRPSFDKGQYTFATHCAACHTIGHGDLLGPDLRGVTTMRSRTWLTSFITAPEKMNAQKDPTALALRRKFGEVRMPNLGLREDDAAVVIDYIDRQSRTLDSSITTPYLRLQQSLHADRIEIVEREARSLATAAGKLGARGAAIRDAAGDVRHASDLESARAAFAKLGDAIRTYAKDMKLELGDNIKVAYCPMARAFWLQAGDRIQNPYFGRAMSDCGVIH
jgi:protein SCO1/2